jgi:hypothetical protein
MSLHERKRSITTAATGLPSHRKPSSAQQPCSLIPDNLLPFFVPCFFVLLIVAEREQFTFCSKMKNN